MKTAAYVRKRRNNFCFIIFVDHWYIYWCVNIEPIKDKRALRLSKYPLRIQSLLTFTSFPSYFVYILLGQLLSPIRMCLFSTFSFIFGKGKHKRRGNDGSSPVQRIRVVLSFRSKNEFRPLSWTILYDSR